MLKQDLRWWLPLLVLAVISSTGVYQWRLHHPSKIKTTDDHIDTIVTDIEVLRYNEAGQLIQNLKSPLAEHYSLSRDTHFSQPRVLIYPTQAGRAIWQITAGTGVLAGKKDHIDLHDGVNMHEVVAHGGKQLVTSDLTWFTDKKIAVTDKAVTATEPGVKVTAVGASFDQALGLIHLLSDVHLNYKPSP